jgi:hypothetical protein
MNNMFLCGQGDINFYDHRTKGSYKSMHLPTIPVGVLAEEEIYKLPMCNSLRLRVGGS